MGVTNHFLLGHKVHSPLWYNQHCYWDQEPMAKQGVGPKGELTVITMLNEYSITIDLDVPLYLHINEMLQKLQK